MVRASRCSIAKAASICGTGRRLDTCVAPSSPAISIRSLFSRDGTTLIAAEGESGRPVSVERPERNPLRAQRDHNTSQRRDELPRFWFLDDRIVAVLPMGWTSRCQPLDSQVRIRPGRQVRPPTHRCCRAKGTGTWCAPGRLPYPDALHFNAAGRFVASYRFQLGTSPRGSLYYGSSALGSPGPLEIFDYDSGQKRSFRQPLRSAPFGFFVLERRQADHYVELEKRQRRPLRSLGQPDRKAAGQSGRSAGYPAVVDDVAAGVPIPFWRWPLVPFSQRNRHVLFDAQELPDDPNLGMSAERRPLLPGTSVVIDAPSACVRAPITVWNLPASGAPVGRPIALQTPTSPPYPTPPEYLRCNERPSARSEQFLL